MSSIIPFRPAPSTPEGESRRARLAVAAAVVGIVAALLAYAISPGVRHAVTHAEHSVRHAVGHVLDRDHVERAKPRPAPNQPARRGHVVRPTAHGETTTGSQISGGFTVAPADGPRPAGG
jgi:hypothetical protein